MWRRCFIGVSFSALIAGAPRVHAAGSGYAATIASLQQAHEAETRTYQRYVDFARQAKAEGYRGIAYLFITFANSELIHAQNFGRILARLDVETRSIDRAATTQRTTRENLLIAADTELESIDAFYPRLLARLQPEGHEDAIRAATYAWSSEKQHREIVQQIRKWSPTFFDQVAKSIDEKTGQYFVCQLCGSTVNAVPPDRCAICAMPSSHYRKIEVPA
jgi:rubrerythrin